MESLQPGYKPSLLMIFACLGEIHAERHHRTKRKADLDEALWATKLALGISSANHPLTTILLNNLANGLWRRYRSSGDEDDLHQALQYGFRVLESLSREDYHRAAVLGTLGTIHASLYDCRGYFRDLQEAISITRKSIDIATRCAGTAPMILFNNFGAYMWTQYCLTGRGEDLDDSVVSFVKALECATNNTVDRVTCLVNSGQVLTQRYHRTGQLQDLSCALENAHEAIRLDPQNGDLAALLKRLDRFLDHRRETTSSVRWSKSHSNANAKSKSGKLLILLAVFISIVAIYAYHPKKEILFSVIAFPIGIIYHWMITRKPPTEYSIFIKGYFAPISSMRGFLGSRGVSHEYTPKLLAPPLIPVPFASSLRDIQTSDFPAYSSLLYNQRRFYNQRRQSIQSVNSEREVKSRSYTGYHRDRGEKVHKRRHSGHRRVSPPREGHNGVPTIGVIAPSDFVNTEFQNKSLSLDVRNVRPQAEVELSRNGMGFSRRYREAYVHPLFQNESNMQQSVGPDSGYGSSGARHDGGRDVEYMVENPSTLLTDEQHHIPNTSPSIHSHSAATKDRKPIEHVSSPLVPSQKLWAEVASEYSEHKIWEERESSPEEKEKEQIPVIRQGHTKLKMDTNSGLAMGNLSSTRAEVVGQLFYDLESGSYSKQEYPGYVNSRQPRSRLQHSFHEEMSRTSRFDGVQSEITLQEEEVQIVPVPEVAQDTVSADAVDHNIEVRLQAPLTSIDDNLMRSRAPRIVEIQDEDREFVEEDFNIDLVDQLAREYLESSAL